MTHKHSDAIAAALRTARPADHLDTNEARLTWERTIRTVGEALRADNANFNADRFRAACYT